MLLEALSDASAEQFLNPLVASHLRNHGGRLAKAVKANKVFWVRSEWEKVDLCYGLADPFKPTPEGWASSWRTGATGDLGQCEVKVCYTHLYAGKIETLAGQLEERRERDKSYDAPNRKRLRYHGLIWLFQHGGIDELKSIGDKLEATSVRNGLNVVRNFVPSREQDTLGPLWPSENGEAYACGMALALVELPRRGR
ncbi:MAG: hypothetical protein RL653_68 [Pseudomonadota bacterium]